MAGDGLRSPTQTHVSIVVSVSVQKGRSESLLCQVIRPLDQAQPRSGEHPAYAHGRLPSTLPSSRPIQVWSSIGCPQSTPPMHPSEPYTPASSHLQEGGMAGRYSSMPGPHPGYRVMGSQEDAQTPPFPPNVVGSEASVSRRSYSAGPPNDRDPFPVPQSALFEGPLQTESSGSTHRPAPAPTYGHFPNARSPPFASTSQHPALHLGTPPMSTLPFEHPTASDPHYVAGLPSGATVREDPSALIGSSSQARSLLHHGPPTAARTPVDPSFDATRTSRLADSADGMPVIARNYSNMQGFQRIVDGVARREYPLSHSLGLAGIYTAADLHCEGRCTEPGCDRVFPRPAKLVTISLLSPLRPRLTSGARVALRRLST